jgi:pimeloyl-ACP methyl ester carboxylesterase
VAGPAPPYDRPMRSTTFTVAGGLRLAADLSGPGDGPAVVLLHGGGQTRHSWHGTAATLASQGWQVCTLDMRGHGESEWHPEGDYSLDGFAGDIAEVARTFERPPALVGASLGGISSMVAIAELGGSEVASALVLVDVAHQLEVSGRERIGDFMRANPDGFASLEEVADAVAAYNPHRPRPTNLSGLRKNVRQRPDGRWVWHWDPRFISGPGGSPDETRTSLVDPTRLEAAALALHVPTLLVRGRSSDLLSEEGAKAFLDIVPHARFADVAGAGHMVAGDRNDVFNQAILEFLDEHRPR